jgi:hypothetical protein
MVKEHQKYFNFSVKEFFICTFASRSVCHRLHTRSLKQMEKISTVEGQKKKFKNSSFSHTSGPAAAIIRRTRTLFDFQSLALSNLAPVTIPFTAPLVVFVPGTSTSNATF